MEQEEPSAQVQVYVMKVGLIYDPIYLEHETGDHEENPARLVEIISLLERSALMAQCEAISPRPASLEELTLAHTSSHVSHIKSFAEKGGGWLTVDTVMSSASYEVALYAVGGTLSGVDAVMEGEVDCAFALVRPPGHHATPQQAMGFCLFNNIAIAAKYALQRYNLERILIVDFDVHHGNGTQIAFYDDPRVLYFSVHEYPFYPGTGSIDENGHSEGKGTTVNVPLPAWSGDAEYIRVFDEILIPVARRYKPKLILVSAGYDAHWADNMSLMQVSVSAFTTMMEKIKELAQELCHGRMVAALEGGYHLQALSYSIKAAFDVLLENPSRDDPIDKAPAVRKPAGIDHILQAVKRVHTLE
jgi:acetoin utilization deacetylase AcuC-like enzyme